jgi:hypothetical protein
MRPIIPIAFLFILLLAACSSDKKPKTSKPVTTDSAPYELLLIADKDWLKTADGTVVMEVLNSNILGLPQQESNFKVMSINPAAFSKTFQGFANIIQLDINSKYTKAEFQVAHDLYAHPQTIAYLTAPNGKSMAEMVIKRQHQIIDMFNDAELKREQVNLHRIYSDKVKREVKRMFDCNLYVPKDINAVKTGKDFLWASSNQIDNRLNICVYSYPLTAEENISEQRFIAIRDSFMRENIKGNEANQYMATNPEFVFTRTLQLEGHTMMEARGLWEMKNDMMGGPFVSYSQIDTLNRRVIVAEGFVYAPEKKKRLFIRQLEAAIRTLELPKDK